MSTFFNNWFPTTYLPSEGFSLAGVNVNCRNDENYNASMQLLLTQNFENSGLVPGFTSFGGLIVEVHSDDGHNSYRGTNTVPGEVTLGKHTWIPLSISAVHRGSGQRILCGFNSNSVGMGDSCLSTMVNNYYGGPIAGDEGQSIQLVSTLTQAQQLQLGTITVVHPKSTIDTTTTQVIVQHKNPQTITVASSAGAAVGDWVIVEQEIPTGSPVMEAVQLTAVGSGTISGIFRNNHPNGVAVLPATVISVDTGGGFGQDRVLVNLSGTSYSTGTIASTTGGGLNGAGTGWSNTMVGGNARNIGAIAINTDTYSGYPFNSTGANGPLKSWHQITTVVSTTSLGIHTLSCAGDAAYKGRGVFPSAFDVRPAAKVLHLDSGGKLVLEYTAHTWSVGHSVECIICPYPDVSGFQWVVKQWTPAAGNLRAWYGVSNRGARRFDAAFSAVTEMPNTDWATTGSDTTGWGHGLYLSGCDIGVKIDWALQQQDMRCALLLRSAFQGWPNDNGSKIDFGDMGYIMANSPNIGIEIQGVGVGFGGKLTFVSSSLLGAENKSLMDFTGAARLHGWLDLEEMVAPSAVANMGRIYTEDNGSAKTRLMVKFGTGAAVQLAIEP